MDLAPTQVYEEEFLPTQRITYAINDEEEIEQVGVLIIDSTPYPVRKGINKIGRHPECDIVLNNETVSKFHAEIEAGVGPGSTFICDLGSSNKTKINNLFLRPQRAYELKDGDGVKFGQVPAVYRLHELDVTAIPETPTHRDRAKSRLVFPGTPDTSSEISTTYAENVSTINDSQLFKDEKNSVFRRPSLPPQRISASSSKTSLEPVLADENLDVSSPDVDRKICVADSDVDVSEMETQEFPGYGRPVETDIHEAETQQFATNGLVRGERRLARENASRDEEVADATIERGVSLHDLETQNFDVRNPSREVDEDVHESVTQKIDHRNPSRDVDEDEDVEDVHESVTQKIDLRNPSRDVDDDDEDVHESVTQKIDLRNPSGEVDDDSDVEDVHESVTQKIDLSRIRPEATNDSVGAEWGNVDDDIDDFPTQEIDAGRVRRDETNDSCVTDICDAVTQRIDAREAARNAYKARDEVTNSTDRDAEARRVRSQSNGLKIENELPDVEASREDGRNSQKSADRPANDVDVEDSRETKEESSIVDDRILAGSSQERDSDQVLLRLSLQSNLSEDGDNEANDDTGKESPILLRDYPEDGDANVDIRPVDQSTPARPGPSTTSVNASSRGKDADESEDERDIFTAPTQLVNANNVVDASSDSETDEEGVFREHREAATSAQNVSTESMIRREPSDDSETDEEGRFVLIASREEEESKVLGRRSSGEDDSAESVDIFEAVTQKVEAKLVAPKSEASNLDARKLVDDSDAESLDEDLFTVPTQNARRSADDEVKSRENNSENERVVAGVTRSVADNAKDDFNLTPTQIIDEDLSDVRSENILKASSQSEKVEGEVDVVASTRLREVSESEATVKDKVASRPGTSSADLKEEDYDLLPTQIIGQGVDENEVDHVTDGACVENKNEKIYEKIVGSEKDCRKKDDVNRSVIDDGKSITLSGDNKTRPDADDVLIKESRLVKRENEELRSSPVEKLNVTVLEPVQMEIDETLPNELAHLKALEDERSRAVLSTSAESKDDETMNDTTLSENSIREIVGAPRVESLQAREKSVESLQTREKNVESLERREKKVESLQTREKKVESLQTREKKVKSLQTRENNLESFQTREKSLESFQTQQTSVESLPAREGSVEDLDYEMAPTQPIADAENPPRSVSNARRAWRVVNLNDTIERNLNDMFDGANDDDDEAEVEEPLVMSTQHLESCLEESQGAEESATTGTEDLTSPPIGSARRKKSRAIGPRSRTNKEGDQDGRLSGHGMKEKSMVLPGESKEDAKDGRLSSLAKREKSTIHSGESKDDAKDGGLSSLGMNEKSMILPGGSKDVAANAGKVSKSESQGSCTSSQETHRYFSSLRSDRKRNVIPDTPEFDASLANATNDRLEAKSSSATNPQESPSSSQEMSEYFSHLVTARKRNVIREVRSPRDGRVSRNVADGNSNENGIEARDERSSRDEEKSIEAGRKRVSRRAKTSRNAKTNANSTRESGSKKRAANSRIDSSEDEESQDNKVASCSEDSQSSQISNVRSRRNLQIRESKADEKNLSENSSKSGISAKNEEKIVTTLATDNTASDDSQSSENVSVRSRRNLRNGKSQVNKHSPFTYLPKSGTSTKKEEEIVNKLANDSTVSDDSQNSEISAVRSRRNLRKGNAEMNQKNIYKNSSTSETSTKKDEKILNALSIDSVSEDSQNSTISRGRPKRNLRKATSANASSKESENNEMLSSTETFATEQRYFPKGEGNEALSSKKTSESQATTDSNVSDDSQSSGISKLRPKRNLRKTKVSESTKECVVATAKSLTRNASVGTQESKDINENNSAKISEFIGTKIALGNDSTTIPSESLNSLSILPGPSKNPEDPSKDLVSDEEPDYLAGLPPVKIYGTSSVPESPSASSTSTIHDIGPISKRSTKVATRGRRGRRGGVARASLGVDDEPFRVVRKMDSPNFARNRLEQRKNREDRVSPDVLVASDASADDSDDDLRNLKELAGRILSVRGSYANGSAKMRNVATRKREETSIMKDSILKDSTLKDSGKDSILRESTLKDSGKGSILKDSTLRDSGKDSILKGSEKDSTLKDSEKDSTLKDSEKDSTLRDSKKNSTLRDSRKTSTATENSSVDSSNVPEEPAPKVTFAKSSIADRKRPSSPSATDDGPASRQSKRAKKSIAPERTSTTSSRKPRGGKRRTSVDVSGRDSPSILNYLTKSDASKSVLDSPSQNEIIVDNVVVEETFESNTSDVSRTSESVSQRGKRRAPVARVASPSDEPGPKRMRNVSANKSIASNESLQPEVVSRLENGSPALSSVGTPTRTRRKTSSLLSVTLSPSTPRHKILFTGLSDKDYAKILRNLGGVKVEDPTKCTVLVTDKVRRTLKFLCALAQGTPIVSVDWLNESQDAGYFLDWERFLLKDRDMETKFGFRLGESLERARRQKLLDGYTVVLTPNIAPPPIPELKSMILTCGGKVMTRAPVKWPEKSVIVSSEEDLVNARKYRSKAPTSVTIQSKEFILTGILQQKLDFVSNKLQ